MKRLYVPYALGQSETNLNIDFPTRPFQNLFPQSAQSVIAFSGTRAIAARTAFVQSWNFLVQQQLAGNLALELGYVATKGTKLYTNWRANAAPPGPGAVNPRRPFPQFGTISEENPRGNSNYPSFQAKLEKRYSKGLTFVTSFDLSQERGLSEYDTRLNRVTTFVYELPFGRGKAVGANLHPLANGIVGGWQLNGISTLRSGFPVRIVLSSDIADTGVSDGQRPNLAGILALAAAERTTERWFNTSALASPAAFTFGNLGRRVLVGPARLELNALWSQYPTRGMSYL